MIGRVLRNTLLSCITLLITAVIIFIYTPLGLHILVKFLPPQIRGIATGNLTEGQIQDLVYIIDNKQSVRVKKLHFTLNPWALLHGRLQGNTTWHELNYLPQRITSSQGSLAITGTYRTYHLAATIFITTPLANDPTLIVNLNGTGSKQRLNMLDVKLGNKSGHLHGHLAAELKNNVLQKFDAQLQIDDANFAANGDFFKLKRVQWQTKIPALAHLLKGASGQITSQGSLTSEASGDALVNFSATQLQWNNFSADSLTINVSGKTAQHQLQLAFTQGKNNINALIQGGYNQMQWHGLFKKLQLENTLLSRLQLQNSSTLAISRQAIDLTPLCLQAKAGTLCFDGHWQEDSAWHANLQARRVQFASLQTHLEIPVTFSNIIDGSINLNSDNNKQVTGTGKITLSPGQIQYQLGKTPYRLPLRGNLNFASTAQGFNSNLDINFAPGERLTGQLTMPGYRGKGLPSAQQNLSGQFQLQIRQLQLLSLLIPELQHAAGTFNANLRVDGTLIDPALGGQARLNNATASIPACALELDRIQLLINADNKGHFSVDGSARSGTGTIKLAGKGLRSHQQLQASLAVNGQRFMACNLPDVKIIVSPDLNLRIAGNKLNLTGNIVVPEAKISPEYFSDSVVTADDIIIIGKDTGNTPSSDLQITSVVKITLGNAIHLFYKGIQAQLSGQLIITDLPNRVTTAQGTLHTVKGKYIAYGQELTITRGLLVFSGGPIIDPSLDIQAVKSFATAGNNLLSMANFSLGGGSILSGQTPTLKLGVIVQGRLQKAAFSFFSQPAGMSQADILSYLLLGRPSSQSSQDDRQNLLAAASALNVGGTAIGSVTSQIKGALGLSDLGLSSDNELDNNAKNSNNKSLQNSTAISLGKYLSPRLYINYSVGLLQSLNTFRVRYSLSKLWMLQGEANSLGSGMDLFYTIERK